MRNPVYQISLVEVVSDNGLDRNILEAAQFFRLSHNEKA